MVGRVIDLDTGRLTVERGRYAGAMARSLIARAGVELGMVEEVRSPDAYAVRLEGITQDFFRLRDNGRPAIQHGDDDRTVAGEVAGRTVTLVNKALRRRGAAERLAFLDESLPSEPPGRRLGCRRAFVLLDHPLSYLLMWSPVIHNYCRPSRPDVL